MITEIYNDDYIIGPKFRGCIGYKTIGIESGLSVGDNGQL